MKGLLLFSVVFICGCLWSQDIRLTVQTGHAATINKVEFSPNDQLIATAGADHKIVLWDVLTGKQFGVLLGHEKAVTEVKFLADGNQIVSSSLDSTLKIWDISSQKRITTYRFSYPLGGFQLRPEHNQLAVIGERVEIIDLSTGNRKPFEFKAQHLFTAVDFTQDGDLLAFGGEKEQFSYLIDLKENTLFRKSVTSAKDIRFYKNNTVMYTTAEGRLIESCLKHDKRKSASTDWMLNTINAIEVNNETIFAANSIGEINLYRRNKRWKTGGMFKMKRSKIKDIDLSHDGRYLAVVGDNRTVIVWDIKAKEVVKSMKGSVQQINDIDFSRDGAFLTVAYNNGALRRTNLISNQSVTNSLRSSSNILTTFSGYTLEKIERENADTIVFKGFYRINSLVYEGSFDQIKPIEVKWSLSDNMLIMKKVKNTSAHIDQYISDLKNEIIHSERYFLNPDLLQTENDSIHIRAEVKGSTLRIVNTRSSDLMHEIETGHADVVTSVAINPVYHFVATAGWDGMIRFWDIESGDLLTIYGAFGNGQFVYLDSEGYYFASKDALDGIGFKVGGRLYSFEQFDLKYNRPDIVAKSLPYFNEAYISAYYDAYKKRLSKLNLEEDQLGMIEQLPQLHFKKRLIEQKNMDLLELEITATDEEHELSTLHLRVNGVPEFSRFGKKIDGKKHKEVVQVRLNPGNNQIQLYATNEKGISSYKESFEIESHQKRSKSEVFLVAIGVSDYEQEQYNLRYARKDAEDFAQFFKFDKGLFNRVNIKLLTDDEVKRDNVAAIKEFAAQAKENDVFILFAAGHGVLNANLDYYFAAHDMDFLNPEEKGIPYELFEEILDESKSRKKVMFLDACHSGEIDKEEVIEQVVTDEDGEELIFRSGDRSVVNKYDINSFDLSRSLFVDMRLNNGSTVVSSAGGAEFAIEGDKWNNGVFTYCLLNGLRDKKADLNGDKVIMLSEIQKYVQNQVIKRTNGRQTPTSRVENLKNDFRIL
ncbi:MAG: caspase family protein [Crocinitomicaceae bacterium]